MKSATPATIQLVAKSEEKRIMGLSDAYDRNTDHGRKQATPFDTTVIEAP